MIRNLIRKLLGDPIKSPRVRGYEYATDALRDHGDYVIGRLETESSELLNHRFPTEGELEFARGITDAILDYSVKK